MTDEPGARADVEVPVLDLGVPRTIHIVGVAGVGMSAIALLLARMGHRVSGSDIKDSTVLARLAAAGVTIHVGNRAVHVPAGADAVVYSTAVPLDNPELLAAPTQPERAFRSRPGSRSPGRYPPAAHRRAGG